MDKDLILAAWSLGRLTGEELPEAAITLMESGFDSPTLRELAGQQRPTMREAGPLFANCLAELKVGVPSPQIAAMRLGQFYAREIVSGRIEPFTGAREIWKLSLLVEIEAFSPFVWPDTVDEIMEAARHLLSLPAI